MAGAGGPAILVPLPGAIDDHQSANADSLGGAWVIPQPDFSPATLADRIGGLLADPARLEAAAAQTAQSGVADAASRLADLVDAHTSQDAMV